MATFLEEMGALINKHGMEGRSNTPDFILAEYMLACLRAFEQASVEREGRYGQRLEPGQRGAVAERNSDFQPAEPDPFLAPITQTS